MAIYHLSVKYISRKQGRSSVAAAAYRSGEKLYSDYDGNIYDFTRKKGIAHTEILLPPCALSEFYNRESLWNAVERAEKRCDSRTAREVEIALPNELELDEQIELARKYVLDTFVEQGMCADIAIHNRDINNPHAHILLTTREVSTDGFSDRKNREWDKRSNVTIWRENWANAQNLKFKENGLSVRVSHESHTARGIDREPTIHLGSAVMALEQRGIQTERSNENQAIISRNKEREDIELLRQLKREQNRSRSFGRSR